MKTSNLLRKFLAGALILALVITMAPLNTLAAEESQLGENPSASNGSGSEEPGNPSSGDADEEGLKDNDGYDNGGNGSGGAEGEDGVADDDDSAAIDDGESILDDYGGYLYGLEEASISKLSENEILEMLSVRWGGNSTDQFNSCVVTPDGSIVAVGLSYSTDTENTGYINKGKGDAIIVKYDRDLNLQKRASWGGNDWDEFFSVACADDGTIFAVGGTYSTDTANTGIINKGYMDAIIVKYDSNLNQQEVVSWGGNEFDRFQCIAIGNNGSVYAAGGSGSWDESNTGFFKEGGYDNDAIIVKYDNNLVRQKVVSWGGSDNDGFLSIAIGPDESVYAAGGSWSKDADYPNRGSNDAVIIKFDSDLTQLSVATWGGEWADEFNSIAISSKGEVYAAGYSWSNDIEHKGDQNALIIKYDSNLSQLKEITWGEDSFFDFYSISITAAGEIIVAGKGSGINWWYNAIIVRYNSDLERQEVTTWVGDDSFDYGNCFYGLVIPGDGAIYAVGAVGKVDTDAVVVKFSGDGGNGGGGDKPPVTAEKKAIVVIPGICGSELYTTLLGEEIRVWPVNPTNAFALPVLQCDENGNPVASIYTKSDDDGIPYGADNGYRNLIEDLKREFEPTYDVRFFSYDWRLSNTKAAGELNDFVKEYDKVILVCHSMGGVVASLYMAEYGANKVDKYISLGTPYLGTPQAVYGFETGIMNNYWWGRLPAVVLKPLVKNMPGLYELLPNDRYFDNDKYYFKNIDTGQPLSKNQTNNYIKSRPWVNQTVYNNATAIYDTQYSKKTLYAVYEDIIHRRVDAYVIVGKGTKTTSGLMARVSPSSPVVVPFIDKSGDGMVSFISATINSYDWNRKPYFVDGVGHDELNSDGKCLQLVKNIINGMGDSKNYGYNCEGAVSHHLSYFDYLVSVVEFYGTKITLACPVDLTVNDKNGNWLGTVTPEYIDAAEGHYYDFYVAGEDNEIKIAFLDEKSNLVLNGTGAGAMNLKIEKINAGKAVYALNYSDVPITEDTVITTDTAFSPDAKLTLLDGEAEVIGEIYPDGFEKDDGEYSAIHLDRTHLVMNQEDEAQLAAFDSRALDNAVATSWKSSDTDVATVDLAGCVTAIGAGTAIITAYNDENGLAAECRVDVTGEVVSDTVKAVNLLQKTVTTNVLSTDYIRIPLQLELDQNKPLSAMSVGALAAASSGHSIESVRLVSDTNGYFGTRVVDDKFVELIPVLSPDTAPDPNIIKATKVKQLKTALEVVVDGKTFTTPVLTINITRTKPSLKAAALKFNRFFPGAEIPVVINTNLGKVSGIELLAQNKTDFDKVDFDSERNIVSLKNAASNPKKLVFNVTVSGFAEGYDKYAVTVKPTAALKKPSAKLSMKSVTMNKTVDLRVIGQNIAGVTVNNADYTVTPPDADGWFSLTYLPGDASAVVAAKTNLKLNVRFTGTDQAVTLPFTVNKPYTGTPKAKLAQSTIILNKRLVDANLDPAEAVVDSATVGVTMTPWDAAMPAEVTGDDAYRFNIVIGAATKTIELALTDDAEAGKTYKLKVGDKTLNVKVIDKDPMISLKAKGTLNVVDPGSAITLTPKFANYKYKGGDVALIDGTGDNDKFVIAGVNRANGAVTLKLKNVAEGAFKPRTKQTVTLAFSDERGGYASKTIMITPKHVNPKMTRSGTQINLQKNDIYSSGRLDLSISGPATAKISKVEIKKAAHGNLYQIREIQNGSYAIGFRENALGVPEIRKVGKGATVQLNVYFAGSDKPMSTSVKIAVG